MASLVAFDARMEGRSGIGRYIRELSGALVQKTGAGRFRFIRTGPPIYGLREQWAVPAAARGADLLHVPHFNIPVFYRGRLVVTVHDLTYLHQRETPPAARAYVRFMLSQIARKAAAVITVSEASKADLLRQTRIRPERVWVTYEAASPTFRKQAPEALAAVRRRYGLGRPFVLTVGNLKPHKNLPFLLDAMDLARKRGLPHELVLAGRADHTSGKLLERIGRAPHVKYLDEVPDPDLAALYGACDAFVMPSLREGFGLPAVEAMACGAPVLVSDRTSLPEVTGEAGMIFDPQRIDDLAGLLYNLLQDMDLREIQSQKSLRQASRFSWERTAQGTLDAYRSAGLSL